LSGTVPRDSDETPRTKSCKNKILKISFADLTSFYKSKFKKTKKNPGSSKGKGKSNMKVVSSIFYIAV